MDNLSNSVFISYRREASAIYALAVYQHLEAQGIDAFYDVESIKAGQFGEIILGQIAARPYFMPILTPGTLPRCVDAGDWVRREFEHALSVNRVLVPLHTPDFEFSDLDTYLPHIATQIKAFNMLELPTRQLKYFKYAMQDVIENYLKPIRITLASVAPGAVNEVARAKEELRAQAAVTEQQLTANTQDEPEKRLQSAPVTEYRDKTEDAQTDPNVFVNRGWLRFVTEDYDGAIEDFTEAIQRKPDDPSVYSNRGWTRMIKKDFAGAIADYTEAIRLKPDDIYGYLIRGDARLESGDRDGAIADYSEVIRLKPEYGEAYFKRGEALAAKGDQRRASADYRHFLTLNPAHPRVDDLRRYLAEHGTR